MRNLVLILSVVISLSILSGCGDSGSDIEPRLETPTDDIVGSWKMTKIIKDGVDLTDDCTTRSVMTISKVKSFSGDDYDAVQNDCVLTKFSGQWVHKTGNKYTFTISGKEFIMELNGDILTADFIHAFDGKHYIEEHIRQ